MIPIDITRVGEGDDEYEKTKKKRNKKSSGEEEGTHTLTVHDLYTT